MSPPLISSLPTSIADRVAVLLREVAGEVVMPRYRSLLDSEVSHKGPGELVTVVDVESERRLTQALLGWLPGSRVVGEEGASAHPSRLDRLDDGDVWLVDPLDGTGNFIAGAGDFAVMLCLLRHGEAAAAWILHPLSGELFTAERGAGAWCNGRRLRSVAGGAPVQAGDLRGTVKTRFLPPALRQSINERSRQFAAVLPGSGCAGSDYPALARNAMHFCMYWRTLPWDHVPGVLLLREAGGHAARPDGRAYRAADRGDGLLAARDEAAWTAARDALFRPTP